MKLANSQRGFTLIEMTVSLGLFTIIMFIATSAFLSIVNTDRKARSVRIAADNLNIALEDMSVNNCTSGVNSILFFTDQNGDRTKYEKFGTSIRRDGTPITSTEIIISGLNFIVSGSAVGSADNKQPMVTIVIDGSLGSGATESGFKIQTTVTQRAYDNQ